MNRTNQSNVPGGRDQGHRGEHNHRGYNNQRRHGHTSRPVSPRNHSDSNGFTYRNLDQRRLNEQWIN